MMNSALPNEMAFESVLSPTLIEIWPVASPVFTAILAEFG